MAKVAVRQGTWRRWRYPRRDLMVVLPKGKEGEGQCRVHLPGCIAFADRWGYRGRLSFYFQGQEVDWVELYHGADRPRLLVAAVIRRTG